MADTTGIQWCNHTWNPWRGCTEVSPGCDNCYAREFSYRNPKVLGVWGEGDNGTRPIAAEATWRAPARWNRDAIAAKEERRVFCGSLMDFFEDRDDLFNPRIRAMRTINNCQNLTWLVLTKRPQNIQKMWADNPRGTVWNQDRNVMFGTTVEDQKRADERIPIMQSVMRVYRARTFLSVEPLLEEIDLDVHFSKCPVDWVIVGGESGGGSRPCDVEWVESVVVQCQKHSVPVFVKQLGSRCVADGILMKLLNKKGGDMSEFPDWLQLRQFPPDFMLQR